MATTSTQARSLIGNRLSLPASTGAGGGDPTHVVGGERGESVLDVLLRTEGHFSLSVREDVHALYFELMRDMPFKKALLCHVIRHYPSHIDALVRQVLERRASAMRDMTSTTFGKFTVQFKGALIATMAEEGLLAMLLQTLHGVLDRAAEASADAEPPLPPTRDDGGAFGEVGRVATDALLAEAHETIDMEGIVYHRRRERARRPPRSGGGGGGGGSDGGGAGGGGGGAGASPRRVHGGGGGGGGGAVGDGQGSERLADIGAARSRQRRHGAREELANAMAAAAERWSRSFWDVGSSEAAGHAGAFEQASSRMGGAAMEVDGERAAGAAGAAAPPAARRYRRRRRQRRRVARRRRHATRASGEPALAGRRGARLLADRLRRALRPQPPAARRADGAAARPAPPAPPLAQPDARDPHPAAAHARAHRARGLLVGRRVLPHDRAVAALAVCGRGHRQRRERRGGTGELPAERGPRRRGARRVATERARAAVRPRRRARRVLVPPHPPPAPRVAHLVRRDGARPAPRRARPPARRLAPLHGRGL